MTRGCITTLLIRLTPAERRTLCAWQRSPLLPAGLVRRARVILLRAEGVTIANIVVLVGLSRRHIYKWLHRFRQAGLAGLADRPGRGRYRRRARPPASHQEVEVG